jgi:hypothetical protein
MLKHIVGQSLWLVNWKKKNPLDKQCMLGIFMAQVSHHLTIIFHVQNIV